MRRFYAVLLGTLLGVLLAEVLLRIWTPPGLSMVSSGQHFWPNMALNPQFGNFVLDNELGYRPKLGGKMFGPDGAKWNDYSIEKPEGHHRVVFLGDSVTFRGALISGFKKLKGEDSVEYWNVGVEGYSTKQEVGYYERFCGQMQPDHVILTFHLNDFTGTPILFMDGDRLVMLQTRRPVARPDQRLLDISHLYRLYIHISLLANQQEEASEEVEREVEEALSSLKFMTQASGTRLSVIVFPWLKPMKAWKDAARRDHRRILRILQKLQIRHYDLLEPLETALQRGLDLRQHPADNIHPSAAFGEVVTKYLLAAGLEL